MASATQATSNHIQSFFEQYPRFNYDPTRETMVQFRSMCRLYGWCHDSEERKQALEGVRDAIALQFNAFYGSGANSLNGWHSLYRALRVQDIPDTVKGCKEGIKTIHVNICDLVDHKEDVPTKHPSEAALAQYSRNSGKIYPRENAWVNRISSVDRQVNRAGIKTTRSRKRQRVESGSGNPNQRPPSLVPPPSPPPPPPDCPADSEPVLSEIEAVWITQEFIRALRDASLENGVSGQASQSVDFGLAIRT
ncbi:MAG: hypothetical protein NXY57DRAFT_965733 [Lentinula lateritia]|nr:MAG: hypothetical protein NXY57DRAFT_965733 [Lentinula lateritia]